MPQDLLEEQSADNPVQYAQYTPRGLRAIRDAGQINKEREAAKARAAAAAAVAAQHAAKLRYDALVKGGMPKDEAFRQVAPDLLDLKAFGSYAQKPSPSTAYTTNIPGSDQKWLATPSTSGNTTYKPADVKPPVVKAPVMPLDAKERLRQKQQELTGARSDFSQHEDKLRKLRKITPEQKAASSNLLSNVTRLGSQAVNLSTNWAGWRPPNAQRTGTQTQDSPYKDGDLVRHKTTGKRYIVQNGKLWKNHERHRQRYSGPD